MDETYKRPGQRRPHRRPPDNAHMSSFFSSASTDSSASLVGAIALSLPSVGCVALYGATVVRPFGMIPVQTHQQSSVPQPTLPSPPAPQDPFVSQEEEEVAAAVTVARPVSPAPMMTDGGEEGVAVFTTPERVFPIRTKRASEADPPGAPKRQRLVRRPACFFV